MFLHFSLPWVWLEGVLANSPKELIQYFGFSFDMGEMK
jgi:hypothetical protein